MISKTLQSDSRQLRHRAGRALHILGAGFLPLAAAHAASAATIPYPNTGTYNPVTYTLTATSTGDVVGYFAGTDAYYESKIGMLDNGVATSAGTGLDNKTSTIGQSFDFGHVNAGDTLTFFLNNSSLNNTLYTDPTKNAGYDMVGDTIGHNHDYVTSYSASTAMFAGVPNGTYLAFEDEQFPVSNFNYADETFVLTNVTFAVPEPVSAGMIGLGALMLATRRNRKVAVA